MNAVDAAPDDARPAVQEFMDRARHMAWTDRLVQTVIFAAAVSALFWGFHTIQDTRDRVLALEVEIRGEHGLTSKVDEIFGDVKILVRSDERRAGAEEERARRERESKQ